jgi:hypothetical protein
VNRRPEKGQRAKTAVTLNGFTTTLVVGAKKENAGGGNDTAKQLSPSADQICHRLSRRELQTISPF